MPLKVFELKLSLRKDPSITVRTDVNANRKDEVEAKVRRKISESNHILWSDGHLHKDEDFEIEHLGQWW